MSSSEIGCEQRVAWLLATSRLLGADPSLAKRPRFLEALSAQGVSVDSPRISRWESGLQAVSRRVIITYEKALGLPEGWLVAVTDGLRRAFGSGVAHRDADSRDAASEMELERLLDLAQGGSANGAEWMRLAEGLSRYDRVFLRGNEWDAICSRLVRELATAVGLGYVRRHQAAASLIRHRSAQHPMMMSLGSFLTHPDNQVFAPVMVLLAELRNEPASDLVLRLLRSDHEHQRKAAASVAAIKLARGHFPEQALRTLETYALQGLRLGDPLDGELDTLDLATRLPLNSWAVVEAGLRSPQLQAQLIRWRATLELSAPRRAGFSVNDLAAQVQQSTPGNRTTEPDGLLRRLLREALFHAHKARRHHAGVLLGASPYAPAIGSSMLSLCHHGDDFLAARAWSLMMRVGAGQHCLELEDAAFAEHRGSIRARALVNAGLCPGVVTDRGAELVARLDVVDSEVERHATLFALGMSGAPELRELAWRRDPTGGGARWWLEQGPAIHDADLPVGSVLAARTP